MTFKIVFIGALMVFFTAGALIPAMLSAGAPSYDGQQTWGFPLPFYYRGGLCIHGECSGFIFSSLLIDLGAATLLGLLCATVLAKRSSA